MKESDSVSVDFSNAKDLSSSLQDSIKSIIQSEKFTVSNVEAKVFNTYGGSLLGKLYEIKINGKTDRGRMRTHNIFAKEIIDASKVNILSIKEIYSVENFAYQELSKAFELLQETANVPMKERFKMPKAYDETSPNAIILENLHARGFKTYDRTDATCITFKYAELAVQELAKFHGLSFVIENKMEHFFNDKITVLKHPLKYVEEWNTSVRNVCEYLMRTYDAEERVKINKFLETFTEKFFKYNNDQKSFICCLGHGDYRLNNVLVKELNGEVEEVMAIDYQLMDYGCPIRDLLFFIFSGTDRAFRSQHMDNLKELYFKTLSSFLNYFNINVETVYPRREFERAYTECLDYCLIKVLYGSVFLFAPKSCADINQLADMTFTPDEKAEMRIRELIEDIIEWGYL